MAAAWIHPGCKPKEATIPPNQPHDSSNVTIQTELQRAVDLPLVHDPSQRPLPVSRPAADARRWALQALEDGYRKSGRTNLLWDATVQQAFAAYVDYSRLNTTNWPALKAALARIPDECDDAMIQYMRVRYREQSESKDATTLEFLRAQEALQRSEHHPAFTFMAGLRAVQSLGAGQSNAGANRITWTTICLQDLARDTNAPVDEVFNAANQWVEFRRGKAWTDYVTRDLLPILEQGWGHTERWFRFRGRTEIRFAWGERGGGYANTVPEAGWEGFRQHLEQAEGFLAKAWQMNTNAAETAYLIMRVELGQGRSRPRMETWFNRAMSLNTNFYDAASLMSFYLEPRWYGSEAAALKFARSCATSPQWGGQVPLVLADLHRSLARYYSLSNSPAYWHRPAVWRDVQASYERFFALNPEAVNWRHNYAKDAYDCGQYAEFLQQAKRFTAGTNHTFFGGTEKFLEMLERASAATARASP